MKHFTEYMRDVSKQTFSAASIVDSRGKQAGSIIIRFTDSYIGYNHNVCVLMYGVDGLDYGTTAKGGMYSQPQTMVRHFEAHGVKCFNFYGERIFGNYQKNRKVLVADSLSRFSDVHSIKNGNKKYALHWVM